MFKNFLTISGNPYYLLNFVSKYGKYFEILYNTLPKNDNLHDYNGDYELFVKYESKDHNEHADQLINLAEQFPDLFFDNVGFDLPSESVSTITISRSAIIENICEKVSDFKNIYNGFLEFSMVRFAKNN